MINARSFPVTGCDFFSLARKEIGSFRKTQSVYPESRKNALYWIPDHGQAVSGMTFSANLSKRLLIL
jgi:hypothetical protein